jgi:predicted alpha/beta superfamily hydrolase
LKTSLIVLSFLFCCTLSYSQIPVHFSIHSLPAKANSDSFFLAGSFNGWNPHDKRYLFQGTGTTWLLDISLEKGNHEFKVTRGSWDKVECSKEGADLPNRSLKVEDEMSVQLDIEEWRDNKPKAAPAHTASKQVRFLDSAFFMPQLNRYRRIWIYLPADYRSHAYPVLYMHDGQNLFDNATSYGGEWNVDEFLDTVAARKCIVVGIAHGDEKRLNEYCPYDMERYGKGEGDLYVDFLVNTLKPYIDNHFRTIKDRAHTYIAGSSMGGLISMYAILKYPKVFGVAGVFSPAFWIAPKIMDDIKTKGKKVKGKIYFYAGKKESESMVTDMLKVFDEMSKVSKAKMTTVIRDDGQHNEATWRNEIKLFYRWISRAM